MSVMLRPNKPTIKTDKDDHFKVIQNACHKYNLNFPDGTFLHSSFQPLLQADYNVAGVKSALEELKEENVEIRVVQVTKPGETQLKKKV